MFQVRVAEPADLGACVDLLKALPDFFTPDTHDTFADEMPIGSTWIAHADGGSVCGFVHAMPRRAASAEITFAAVLPTWQRRGVGRALMSAVLLELARRGVAVVEVKTLDASSDYEPYIATRAFWESQGFVQIDTIDPLPGWQPGNPSAIYVASLRPTVDIAGLDR